MIWIWISLIVLIISLVFFIKKIPYQYLFIALIPIQKYGFSLLGLNVKPFYVFSLLLFVVFLWKNKNNLLKLLGFWSFSLTLIVFLFASMVVTALLNNGGFSSIKYIGVVFLSTISCLIFIESIKKENNKFHDLLNSIVFSSIIYSAFFLLTFILFHLGIELPETVVDMVADSDNVRGVLYIYHNSGLSTQATQLRITGFTVDPNAFSITLFAPICILFSQFFTNNNRPIKILIRVFSLIIVIACSILSLSRTAWILIGIISILFGIYFITSEVFQRKTKVVVTCGAIVAIAVILLVGETYFKGKLFYTFLSSLYSRSSLMDENGRFSLWYSSTKHLLTQNPVFGLGLGVFSNDAGLECHNTWLEYYVGCGLLVGALSTSVFIYVFYTFALNCKIYSYHYKTKEGWILFVSLLIVSLSLLFISYLASPDFWLFFALASRFESFLPDQYRKRNKTHFLSFNLSNNI